MNTESKNEQLQAAGALSNSDFETKLIDLEKRSDDLEKRLIEEKKRSDNLEKSLIDCKKQTGSLQAELSSRIEEFKCNAEASKNGQAQALEVLEKKIKTLLNVCCVALEENESIAEASKNGQAQASGALIDNFLEEKFIFFLTPLLMRLDDMEKQTGSLQAELSSCIEEFKCNAEASKNGQAQASGALENFSSQGGFSAGELDVLKLQLFDHGERLKYHEQSLFDHEARLEADRKCLLDNGERLEVNGQSLLDLGTQIDYLGKCFEDLRQCLMGPAKSSNDWGGKLSIYGESLNYQKKQVDELRQGVDDLKKISIAYGKSLKAQKKETDGLEKDLGDIKIIVDGVCEQICTCLEDIGNIEKTKKELQEQLEKILFECKYRTDFALLGLDKFGPQLKDYLERFDSWEESITYVTEQLSNKDKKMHDGEKVLNDVYRELCDFSKKNKHNLEITKKILEKIVSVVMKIFEVSGDAVLNQDESKYMRELTECMMQLSDLEKCNEMRGGFGILQAAAIEPTMPMENKLYQQNENRTGLSQSNLCRLTEHENADRVAEGLTEERTASFFIDSAEIQKDDHEFFQGTQGLDENIETSNYESSSCPPRFVRVISVTACAESSKSFETSL